MKLNRRDLRRLIESVINEENPGSKFAAAEKKGEKNKSDAFKQKATQELQKTYDWFIDVVFPAIESDKWPIVADDDYHTVIHLGNRMIPKGSSFKSLKDTPVSRDYNNDFADEMTLADFYNNLEDTVVNEKLRVTMQSEQPDEFEEEVAKAKKDNPPNSQVNESLSRGSLYRRRYYGRY